MDAPTNLKKKGVQSPYVVVLGADKVRRKPDPTTLPSSAREKQERHVYGVLPPIKTMAHDLIEAKEHSPEKKESLSRLSSFFSKNAKKQDSETLNTPQAVVSKKSIVTPVLPSQKIEEGTPLKAKTPDSPYRAHFTRGIEKKGYLKSKLAVQLPRRAKIGAGIAILAIMVTLPILALFQEKSIPPTAGVIVAQGTEALVAQIGKAIDLPSTETPLVVVATADDIRRLNVPDAKPGNKILIYQEVGKIVVYDADTDKVLGVVNRARP